MTARGARALLAPLIAFGTLVLAAASAGCANGVTTETGGTGGTTQTTATAGTGGTGGTVETGATGGTVPTGAMGGTGGTGGTTTTPTTTIACDDPAVIAGYGPEQESNNLAATATVLPAGDQGFSAALCPAGDIDVFAIPITVQGASLRVEVKGNGDACPPGAQTYVRVFDEDNVLLAQDTNGGAASCSLISPSSQPGVASLALGTYYVQVENLTFDKIPSYVLETTVKEPSCGDTVLQQAAGEQCDDGNNVSGDGCTQDCLVEAVCGDGITHVVAGEQCDDGNVVAGDCCSPTCQFEATLLTETEPNTQNAPNPMVGYNGAVGAIVPGSDTDWFSFEVTEPGSTVTISTSDGCMSCPLGADTQVFLFKAPNLNNVIAEDDDAGDGSCSLIAPALNAGATNLAVGTYYVMVEDFGNNDTIDAYVLLVNVAAPGCGDGLVQIGEQCDDGGAVAGDGCSDTCQFEASYTTETEPNPLATPNSVNGFDGVIASIQQIGDQDAFSFDVTVAGSSVIIEVSDGLGACPNFDSQLTLYDPMGVILVTDDDGGLSPCSKISPLVYPQATNLAVGTYKVLVNELFNDETVPQYVLTIDVNPPSCGDFLLAMGEECDDGNTAAGDGCSDICKSEAPWEIEPNDTLNTATGLWPGFTQWKGSIQSFGDQDWFKFTVMTGQSVTLLTHTIGDAASCPVEFDSEIFLVNSAGNLIVSDDDLGPSTCSLISPMTYPQAGNLPGGAYYVHVHHYNDMTLVPAYQLDLTVQ